MTSEVPRVTTGSATPQIEVEELITAQARLIDELRARVDALESRMPGNCGSDPHLEGEPSGDTSDGRTGRRQLLSLAGMAAAGAVAGTTVLASQATPVAAAAGTFDGNPAVLATSPTVAIRATVTNGTAIEANAEGDDDTAVYGGVVSQTGQTFGVWGEAASVDGYGVFGLAGAATGSATGVRGESQSTGGTGVYGRAMATSGSTRGVWGETYSPVGSGVYGTAASVDGNAVGVVGAAYGDTGRGVAGYANGANGIGLAAEAPIGVEAHAERTHLLLGDFQGGYPEPPLTAGLTRARGELVFDGSRWWVCVATGTPGEWRSLAGPTTAGSLNLLDAAVRAYDSRAGLPPTTVVKGKLNQNQERTVDLRVGGGLPTGARAALINLTVTNTSDGGGFLKVFKPGSPVPTASAINWSSGGQNIANSATVTVSATGGLTIRCGGTGASTDVIIDVAGYYL